MKRYTTMKTSIEPNEKSEGQVGSLLGNCRTDMEISFDEARDLLRSDDRVILLDVRSDGEMCLGHIKGARFMPPGLI